MNKFKLYIFGLLSGISLTTLSYFTSDKLWHGIIKFPMSTKTILPIRVYYAGGQIPTHIHRNNRQVSFDIPESKVRNSFYLVITDQVDIINEQNTIKHLKVPENHPYKLYLLEYKSYEKILPALGTKSAAEDMGSWLITQKELDEDRFIPDNAITVCYHPHLVKTVEGGNGLELPKIIMNEQILTQLTDEELKDASNYILLTALDTDSIHARQNVLIKPNFAKKTVMSMICS